MYFCWKNHGFNTETELALHMPQHINQFIFRLNTVIFPVLLAGTILLSCKVQTPSNTGGFGAATDTIAIAPQTVQETGFKIETYQPEATRDFKLIHTKLELGIDWKNQHIKGKANLILKPYFYKQSRLVLDAKNFEIHSVSINTGAEDKVPDYQYNGRKLSIEMGQEVLREQEIQVNISYTAKGYDGDTAVIKPDDQKGFYFVNPSGEKNNLPQQVWTQGETESNSRWFPTIDAPNQKSTQEVFITVEDQFVTLSNGKLVYSMSNQDSTRTDYWKMDIPHAPYLFMFAAGDFAVVEDKSGDLPVNYYIEKDYAPYAKDIFGNTPEMISYFGDLLKVPFPWPKYSQIIVRNFVTGAMENTTASVFMEDLNMDRRELLDYNWDDIISHELFHQWFGDYVTCESWANLPLNESFATYSEYLWYSHKYGADEASYHLLEDLEAYLEESKTKNEKLVRFGYIDSEEMFDAHSYSKGGLILHALRNYVGDDAFFKSLELYLKSHAFGKAEIHELRLAFEQITGEDLNWFFNQWFMDAGHPILKVEDEYDAVSKKAILKVRQSQDLEKYPVYNLNLTVDVWQGSVMEQFVITIDRPYQEFEFNAALKPDLFLMDSEHILVGEIVQIKEPYQLAAQYTRYPDNMRARLESLRKLQELPLEEAGFSTLGKALSDSFWVIRQEAVDFFESDTTGLISSQTTKLRELAISDPKSAVRTSAFSALITHTNDSYCDVYKQGMSDSSYSVAGYSLYGYLHCNVEDKTPVIDQFAKESNFNITSTLADYFISEEIPGKTPWFIDRVERYRDYEQWYFIKFFGMYLSISPEEEQTAGITPLSDLARNHPKFYIRLAAYQSLQLIEDAPGVTDLLNQIKADEKDSRVLQNIE